MTQPLFADLQISEQDQSCNQGQNYSRGGRNCKYGHVFRRTRTLINICRDWFRFQRFRVRRILKGTGFLGLLMKVLERLLWVSGAVLLSIFIGHLTLGELQRAHAVAAFKSQQSIASTVAVSPDPAAVSTASTVSTKTTTETTTTTDSVPDNPTGEIAGFDVDLEPPDQSLWSSGRVASYAASLKAETSEVIGLFSIPRLDLEVPLYDKASDLHMDRGIARIEGTAQPGEAGNMGIAGHRDGYFRVLKDIKFGDEMIVTSVNGPQVYRVEQLMIVDPSAIEVLDPTEETAITLVTCYPFYFVGHAPERFIVRAVLQD